MTDQNTLDKEIATIRKLIFEYSPDELETRLRMAVVYIRADEELLPKKIWTDLIQDIFKEYVQSATEKAVHDAMWRLKDKQDNANKFSGMLVVGVGHIHQELERLKSKKEAE
jgi:hypothetical protein